MSRNRLVLFGVFATLVFSSVYFYTNHAPDHYKLTTPIDLNAPPTFVTEMKLRLGGDEVCYQALADADILFERLPDETKGDNCEFKNVALLAQSHISWGRGVTLRCPMLAGIIMWGRHTLQPAAAEILGDEIVRVNHYGTYACRNINNTARGPRSEHAFANAVDVAGFVLEGGAEISIARDWGTDTDKGRFLRKIHKHACRRFNTVLGPDYNALHRDHFHFDNGPSSVCR